MPCVLHAADDGYPFRKNRKNIEILTLYTDTSKPYMNLINPIHAAVSKKAGATPTIFDEKVRAHGCLSMAGLSKAHG